MRPVRFRLAARMPTPSYTIGFEKNAIERSEAGTRDASADNDGHTLSFDDRSAAGCARDAVSGTGETGWAFVRPDAKRSAAARFPFLRQSRPDLSRRRSRAVSTRRAGSG